jgi:hypothetical protein
VAGRILSVKKWKWVETYKILNGLIDNQGVCCSVVVKARCYKLEGRVFKTQ